MNPLIRAEALDGVAAAVSKLAGDAPVAVVAIQNTVSRPGQGRFMDVVGGTAGVDIGMAGALALYLIRHAIAGYQAEAAKGTPPGKTFERLKAAEAAEAALTPDHAVVADRERHDA